MARFALILLAQIALAGASSGQSRWTEALREANGLADDLARARARVEVLYAAGDLPGALQEGLAGLRAHAGDAVLLRRTCQLALALRIADVADESAAELSAALPVPGMEESAERWWQAESAGLTAAARELRGRERELHGAVRRAQLVSGALALAVLLAWIGLLQGTKPPASGSRKRAA